jgi:hypothetical protein
MASRPTARLFFGGNLLLQLFKPVQHDIDFGPRLHQRRLIVILEDETLISQQGGTKSGKQDGGGHGGKEFHRTVQLPS